MKSEAMSRQSRQAVFALDGFALGGTGRLGSIRHLDDREAINSCNTSLLLG
jgi:hypothetical protein